VFFSGSEKQVFDAYFERFTSSKTNKSRLFGYTSWYNKFGKITKPQILEDLQGLKQASPLANIFQIDDGWQKEIGVWTEANQKFPDGMKVIADEIHSKGMQAGIWLAPFAVQRKGSIAKTHPDWLIRKNGKPVLGCVAWGGAYTLDILNPNVREYLKTTFSTVLDEWGFDMVKLDFLYAQCMFPRAGLNRGQIMAFAMNFLRECVGDKILLGCGVPLGAAIGRVDACRIGCDADIQYKPRFFNNLNREIISTTNAVNNALTRSHLRRVFLPDPDVFFLRQKGDNLRYNILQKKALAKVCGITGDVLFVSDNAGKYDSEAIELLRQTFSEKERLITARPDGLWNYFLKTECPLGNQKNYTLDLYNGVLNEVQ
jgi:alpha-galactosidase